MTLRRWFAGMLVALAGVASCDFATDVEVLEVTGTGVLFGQAFLDLNGSGGSDAADQPLRGALVVLRAPGSGDVVLDATTDSLGVFVLLDVPVGRYELGIDSAVLSDSLTALGSGGSVTVELGDTTFFSIGATYPKLTLEEVRTADAGRRVFTEGVTMNSRLPSTDGTVHLIDTTAVAYLRSTDVSVAGGSLQVGDSVRFLGTTGTNNGQPVLTSVTPYLLQRGLALPPPVEAATGTAATAAGGLLDAALVRIRAAEISDTSTAPNGDFHFWANDGSGSVEIVFKWFRNIPSSSVRPDTVVRVQQLTGLLTPYDDETGSVRWRVLPRSGSEVVLENKLADIAVGTAFSPTTATATDTVEIQVTAQNPATSTHTATGVSIEDVIPAGLTFLSATATRGTYDEGTGVWDIGDFAPGVADTLRIDVEVTAGPGPVTNTAVFDGLVLEIETSTFNNSASAELTVS